jgi:hypothetical protein
LLLVTTGVGAAASPVHAPAGLLISHGRTRVLVDGGPGAAPESKLDAWLVCDERSELYATIRRLARSRGLKPKVERFHRDGLTLTPKPVVHTNHPTYGYVIETAGARVVWAPEFLRFPRWAAGADLMFAEAASWNRPIFFAGRVGGHLDVLAVARAAQRARVRRLVFSHIGRPTLRALRAGLRPPFGEFACDGQAFVVRRARS